MIYEVLPVKYDKLVISGPLVERLRYSLPTVERRLLTEEERNKRSEKRREDQRRFNMMLEVPDPERTTSSVSRARNAIRRIVYTNAWQYYDRKGILIPPKFCTFTFAENIQDLKHANRIFSVFIQRFNRRFKNELTEPLKYICVPEFQERGAVHYHVVLFNFPFMHKVFSKIRAIYEDRFELKAMAKTHDAERVIAYVSKYISKQSSDGRFWGQKRYFASKGLERPEIAVSNHENWNIGIPMVAEELKPKLKISKVIEASYVGRIEYDAYYLGDGKKLEPELLALLRPLDVDLSEVEPEVKPEPPKQSKFFTP